MSNYIKRAVYKGQNDVVYENYVHNSVDKINKFRLVSAEETRRALILESFGDFDRELCLAAKERLEQLLERDFSLCDGTAKEEVTADTFDTSASAPPSTEASSPAEQMAERQFQHCVSIIDKHLEDSVTDLSKPYHCTLLVHRQLAERLSGHYDAGGYYFDVTPKNDDMSEIKISFWK